LVREVKWSCDHIDVLVFLCQCPAEVFKVCPVYFLLLL
jgi:hypothetical protein